MELRHLRYFIRAAELLNFTKAAESLFVSQPTLSVQIHQLEEELGTELFARVGRNVRLTDAGRLFLTRALQAVKELEEGSKEIDALAGVLRGNLTVGTLPLYGSKFATSWIAEFCARHPNVSVKLRAGSTEDIEAAVVAGTIDIGFTFLPVQASELISKELFKESIVFVVSKKHRLAGKKIINAEDIKEVPLALPSERISATKVLGKYLEELGVQANIRANFDDGHALIEFVKRTEFATLLPMWALRFDEQLATIELAGSKMRLQTGAIWSHLSPAAAIFLTIMEDQCSKLMHELNVI